MTAAPTEKLLRLQERYSSALRDYLARRDEVDLQRAYELGRCVFADGIALLDLATAHHTAVVGEIRGRPPRDLADTIQTAGAFFAETLSPFEMTSRAFRDSAIALRHLYEGGEAEVKRIAHALHDEAGQLLASVHLALRDVEADLPPTRREHMAKAYTLLGQVENELRRLSHELRPTALDDLGLLPALENLAKSVSLRTGLAVTVQCDQGSPLPLVVETAVYRIVQESLTNATKHARATQVTITLWRTADSLRCTIADDGRGFDVAATLARHGTERGLGLPGILERLAALGGALHVASAPGAGTRLRIIIPVEATDVAQRSARG
jgi:signal transduction histidine kinase